MSHTFGARAISATGLTKRFKTGRTYIEVLKSVDFDALHGDVTMVMGPSGSGKSTLVATLSGLLKPDDGQVRAMDTDLWSLRPGQIDRFRLDHCGFIFQGFNLFGALTALQQVAYILKHKGFSPEESRAKAEIALAEVGLTNRMNQRPSELSGGEKQRVAIARALANDPAIILGDEPTGNLDSGNTRLVVEEFQRLAHEEGRAVICVTHDTGVAAAADRRIHMLDGRIVEGD